MHVLQWKTKASIRTSLSGNPSLFQSFFFLLVPSEPAWFSLTVTSRGCSRAPLTVCWCAFALVALNLWYIHLLKMPSTMVLHMWPLAYIKLWWEYISALDLLKMWRVWSSRICTIMCMCVRWTAIKGVALHVRTCLISECLSKSLRHGNRNVPIIHLIDDFL